MCRQLYNGNNCEWTLSWIHWPDAWTALHQNWIRSFLTNMSFGPSYFVKIRSWVFESLCSHKHTRVKQSRRSVLWIAIMEARNLCKYYLMHFDATAWGEVLGMVIVSLLHSVVTLCFRQPPLLNQVWKFDEMSHETYMQFFFFFYIKIRTINHDTRSSSFCTEFRLAGHHSCLVYYMKTSHSSRHGLFWQSQVQRRHQYASLSTCDVSNWQGGHFLISIPGSSGNCMKLEIKRKSRRVGYALFDTALNQAVLHDV